MRKFIVIAMLALSSQPALAQEDRSWHLLTQSEGGTVSLLKDLTKHECEFAMHRVKGEPATDEEIAAENKRLDAISAEAEDMCAHPEKYFHSADNREVTSNDRVNATCDSGKNMGYVYYTLGGGSISPGDVKSAECFQ